MYFMQVMGRDMDDAVLMEGWVHDVTDATRIYELLSKACINDLVLSYVFMDAEAEACAKGEKPCARRAGSSDNCCDHYPAYCGCEDLEEGEEVYVVFENDYIHGVFKNEHDANKYASKRGAYVSSLEVK